MANIVLIGKILKELGQYDEEAITAALKKVISAKRADMLEINLKAFELGYNIQ